MRSVGVRRGLVVPIRVCVSVSMRLVLGTRYMYALRFVIARNEADLAIDDKVAVQHYLLQSRATRDPGPDPSYPVLCQV